MLNSYEILELQYLIIPKYTKKYNKVKIFGILKLSLNIKFIAKGYNILRTVITNDFSITWAHEGSSYNVQLCFKKIGQIYMISPKLEMIAKVTINFFCACCLYEPVLTIRKIC